jgi:hypothetical protein
MAMEHKSYQARDDAGAVIVSPTIDVFEAGTLNRVALYSDDLVTPTPLSNPFTGGVDGRFGFYTPDGLVDIVVDSSTTIEAELFDYTLADTPIGSAVESINGEDEADQTLETGSSGVDFTIVSAGGVHTFRIPTASGAARGLLSPVHWSLFNSKLGTLGGLTASTQSFATGNSGNDFNIADNGTSIHIFNIPTASATKRGLLSSADWATFNGKQAAFAGTTLQYVRGDGTLATLNTTIVPEGSNQYHTTARARAALSATAPVTYNSSSGVIAMPAAATAQNGYLTSADWNTFNGKLGSAAPSITKDSDTLKVDGTRYVRTSDTTVDTSVAETTLSTVTLGGAPSVERTYRVRSGGTVRVGTGGTDTVRIKAYLGGSVVWDSGALDLTDVTALPYMLDLDITVRTAGAAGVVQTIGRLAIQDSVVATLLTIKSTNTTAVTLTGTPILKTTVTFSVSDATNQIVEKSTVISTLG